MKENAEMVQFCFVGRRNVSGTMKESRSTFRKNKDGGMKEDASSPETSNASMVPDVLKVNWVLPTFLWEHPESRESRQHNVAAGSYSRGGMMSPRSVIVLLGMLLGVLGMWSLSLICACWCFNETQEPPAF